MKPTPYRLIAILGLAVLTGTPVNAADEDSFQAPDRSVTLDAPTKLRLGIATQPAQAVQYQAEAPGFGMVLAIDTIAQADADLTAAEAADRASQAALVRARGLFSADTGVSRQVLESAEHQAATDAAQLALAQRKSTAAWGYNAPWRTPEERRAILARIVTGDAAIVRATFPANAGGTAAAPTIRIERLGAAKGDKGWTAKSVWTAPADPTVPGRSVFALIDDAQGLAQGEHIRAFAPIGPVKQGAIVPADSVIIAEGHTWLYIEEKPDYFVRQAIDLSEPTADGYFTPSGVKPGEAVVTDGAGHLLARETGAAE